MLQFENTITFLKMSDCLKLSVITSFFFLTALYPQDAKKPETRVKGPILTHEAKRLKRLKKVRENQGTILFRYARELHSMGNLKHSMHNIELFLILYPEHSRVFEAIKEKGEILLKMNRPKNAADCFIMAFKNAHNEERGALAYLKAGKILVEVGKWQRARDIFSSLIRWKPSSRISKLADIELKSLHLITGDMSGVSKYSPKKKNEEIVKKRGSEKANIKVIKKKTPVDRKIGEGILREN